MNHFNLRFMLWAVGACGCLLSAGAHADMTDPASVKRDDYGPATAYGETPAEVANKKVMFDWVRMNMIDRKPKEAFEKYVSKSYCNHGHLSTGGRKECADYQETYTRWVNNYTPALKPGEKVEIPVMASVNGEMVTMFGAGVDIFRVHDGKVTDHWDGSPPARVTLKGHGPEFTKWVNGDRAGPPPAEKDGPTKLVTVDETVLTSVNPGPLTPYGETTAEMNAKSIVFRWNYLMMIQGKGKEAFEKYVSADFCDHSHMVTRGKKDCATREEVMASPIMQFKAAKIGDRLEYPTLATVDGELVTMYGAGIDLFRVHDGKITDHWDASPPRAVTVAEHAPEVSERLMKVIAGELPVGPGPGGPGGAGRGAGGPGGAGAPPPAQR